MLELGPDMRVALIRKNNHCQEERCCVMSRWEQRSI
jgi:hypothetical protein